MTGDEIEIVEYDLRWRELFLLEKGALTKALGPLALEVHHIGSTAVPGLAAKPVVDIMVAARSIMDPEAFKARLSDLDYALVPQDDANRLYFRKGAPRTHHLHIVKIGTWTYFSHLWFRDYLTDHAITAEEYECLKRVLAKRSRTDREAYVRGKGDMIAMILERAVRERTISLLVPA